MRYLVIIITFTWMISLQLSGQVPVPEGSRNYVDANGKRQGHWIITGAMKRDGAYRNDEVYEKGNYVDSRKEGKWLQYYPGGSLKSEIWYVQGRPTGFCRTFYIDTLQCEGAFKSNRWTGDYKFYYPSGQLYQHFHFDSLGRRNGMQYWFWPNGQPMGEGNYTNGKENGWQKSYYENGKLKSEMFYIDGVIDSARQKLYPENDPD